MNKNGLLKRGITHYKGYYRLVAVAVIVMMAVLSGSLLVGDAVRGTLVDRVQERLGDTETVIASGTGFLNEEILQQPLLREAKAYLLSDGFVSFGGKMIPVMVWGSDRDSLGFGEARINEPLSRKLDGAEDFVLHLPAHSLVPSGSLFVTKSYSTQLRLHTASIKTVEEGGNLLLRNEQALPLNVFMNREELAELMGLEGKINLILSPRQMAEQDLAGVWNASYAGLRVEGGNVVSDRIFLPQSVVEVLQPQRTALAYLVNDICTPTDSVPYSFVTATDVWKGEPLKGQEMILSDYAANRLKVQVGDTVQMEYFITRGMKSLETQAQSFVVKQIVPLEDFEKDKYLQAEFPGLSNVERCADWDSDLPIHMDRIQKIDEDFWYAHHQTPKAIVAYDAVAKVWGSSFGVATALQCSPSGAQWERLTPQLMGVTVVQPREAGLYAAQNGTDFSSLFLALGFFIILSAVLLMQNPLVEMLIQRKPEIQLYATLGFSRRRINRLLMGEIFTVVPIAGLVGVLCGVLYAGSIIFLLGNVWSGATHTEGFRLHIHASTLILAWLSGMVVCFLTAVYCLRAETGLKNVPLSRSKHVGESFQTPRRVVSNVSASRFKAIFLPVLFLATLALYLYNKVWAHSIVLFVVCGLLWLVASGMWLMTVIKRKAGRTGLFSQQTMMWKSLAAQRSQIQLSYWAIATGVFTVFAVGLNRPDFSRSVEDVQTTGGYDLWCENRIAMEYDLNNSDVRQKLSLQDLGDEVRFLQCLKYTQDEASCLNLNKVATPTVLGIDLQSLQQDFTIDASVLQPQAEGVYPILMDEESLLWSMMKSVGDTLHYQTSEGKPATLLIAGSYPTGIFHGSALMDKTLFRQLWKDESGSRLMLVRTGGKQREVKDLLETALNEYGIACITTTERLEEFFTVTGTYLTIFLTLGGLGLLLGIFSLVIVMRKIMISRRAEIQMLRTLGYSVETLRKQFTRESLCVPLVAIAMGSVGSIISISANVSGAGWGTWLMAFVALALLFGCTMSLLKRMIKLEIK